MLIIRCLSLAALSIAVPSSIKVSAGCLTSSSKREITVLSGALRTPLSSVVACVILSANSFPKISSSRAISDRLRFSGSVFNFSTLSLICISIPAITLAASEDRSILSIIFCRALAAFWIAVPSFIKVLSGALRTPRCKPSVAFILLISSFFKIANSRFFFFISSLTASSSFLIRSSIALRLCSSINLILSTSSSAGRYVFSIIRCLSLAALSIAVPSSIKVSAASLALRTSGGSSLSKTLAASSAVEGLGAGRNLTPVPASLTYSSTALFVIFVLKSSSARCLLIRLSVSCSVSCSLAGIAVFNVLDGTPPIKPAALASPALHKPSFDSGVTVFSPGLATYISFRIAISS